MNAAARTTTPTNTTNLQQSHVDSASIREFRSLSATTTEQIVHEQGQRHAPNRKRKKNEKPKQSPAPKLKRRDKGAEPKAEQKKPPQHRTKRATCKKESAKSKVAAVQETRLDYMTFHYDFLHESDDDSDETPDAEDANNYSWLRACDARIWMKALRSSDQPHYGADLLITMVNCHNTLPGVETCRDLIDLLVQGPQYGFASKVPYPGCVRLETAHELFDVLKTISPMRKVFDDAQPWSYWSEAIEMVTNPSTIYCVESDTERTTSAALFRVGHSLNVKHSGMLVLEYLLENIVSPHLDKENQKSKSEVESSLRTSNVVSSLLSSGGSTEGALIQAARATISIWIHYGHYLSTEFNFPRYHSEEEDSNMKPAEATIDEIEFVSSETKRLTDIMGKILSYIAWLYTIEHKEKSLRDCAPIIGSVLLEEIHSTVFDPSKFLDIGDGFAIEGHWNDIKLKFALSLDKHVLGKAVAEVVKCDMKWFGTNGTEFDWCELPVISDVADSISTDEMSEGGTATSCSTERGQPCPCSGSSSNKVSTGHQALTLRSYSTARSHKLN